MNAGLSTGLSTSRRIEVDAGRTISFMGDANRVYATPELVRDIEHTCRDLLVQHLDDGMDSVGTRVEVDHVAATPLGMWVDITVSVQKIDGRMVSFAVECKDQLETIAHGTHNRFIVDVERAAARLAKKRAQLG